MEILHVKARSHATFLHRRTVSPSLTEKNDLVCLIYMEWYPSLIKIIIRRYVKKLF